jgi:hypothetical protein
LPMAPVVALKLADRAVAATATEAGTVRVELEFERVTVAPPLGAGWAKVTEHLVEELGPKLVGLHARADTSTGATRLTVVMAELPL